MSSKTRLFAAWFVLVAITVMYLWIDHSADEDGTLIASTVVTVSAIFLALVKFRIVLREFMDVRHAPILLRRATEILVVVIAVSLFATYFIGRAIA